MVYLLSSMVKLIQIKLNYIALKFLDSAGIGLILGRYNEICKIRGIIGVINLSPYIKKIMKISGLFQIIDEYKSLSDFKKKVGISI